MYRWIEPPSATGGLEDRHIDLDGVEYPYCPVLDRIPQGRGLCTPSRLGSVETGARS
jgi:hypothetical protein